MSTMMTTTNGYDGTRDPDDRAGGLQNNDDPTSARSRDATRLRSMLDRGADRTDGADRAGDAAPARPTTMRMPANNKPIRALMSDPSRGAAAVGTTAATRIRTPEQSGESAPRTPAASAAPVAAAAAPSEPVRSAANPRPASRSNNEAQRVAAPIAAAASAPAATPVSDGRAHSYPAASSNVTYPPRPRRYGLRRPVLTIGAVLAGTAIGIGLYAGGGDLISSIFSRRGDQQQAEANPAAVTDRPVQTPAPATDDSVQVFDAEPSASNAPTTAPTTPPTSAPAEFAADAHPSDRRDDAAPESHGAHMSASRPTQPGRDGTRPRSDADNRPTMRRGDATEAIVPEPVPMRPVETDNDHRDAEPAVPTARTSSPTPPAASAPRTSSGRFVVQVRATPSEQEANAAARKLKSKGAAGVTIVQTKQHDGTTLYRVRYSGSGTASEVQSAATRAGYKNVWVMPKKGE